MRVSVRKTGRFIKCKVNGKTTRRNIYETCFALPNMPLGTEVVSLGMLSPDYPRSMVAKDYFVEQRNVTDVVYYTR